MNEADIIKILGGAAAGIISTVTALAFIFPTKDKITTENSACRKEIFDAIKDVKDKLADKADRTNVDASFKALNAQLGNLNNNVVRMMTIIELKLGVKPENE